MRKDQLGDRMKEFYEDRSRIYLPRRTYSVIRIDGKAFHTYTKGLERPFDMPFIEDMDKTAAYLCKNIQGAKFAFVQSDEISIVLTDFEKIQTSAWYDGNIQKITSVSASIATAKFNELRVQRAYYSNEELGYGLDEIKPNLAFFDSRVFTIPAREEVINYCIWRQQDTVRNSISSVAQSLYSPKELHGKNTNVQQEMIFQKGINWDKYNPKLKRGRIILKEIYSLSNGAVRSRWVSVAPPTFTKERDFFNDLLP